MKIQTINGGRPFRALWYFVYALFTQGFTLCFWCRSFGASDLAPTLKF